MSTQEINKSKKRKISSLDGPEGDENCSHHDERPRKRKRFNNEDEHDQDIDMVWYYIYLRVPKNVSINYNQIYLVFVDKYKAVII